MVMSVLFWVGVWVIVLALAYKCPWGSGWAARGDKGWGNMG